MNQKW